MPYLIIILSYRLDINYTKANFLFVTIEIIKALKEIEVVQFNLK